MAQAISSEVRPPSGTPKLSKRNQIIERNSEREEGSAAVGGPAAVAAVASGSETAHVPKTAPVFPVGGLGTAAGLSVAKQAEERQAKPKLVAPAPPPADLLASAAHLARAAEALKRQRTGIDDTVGAVVDAAPPAERAGAAPASDNDRRLRSQNNSGKSTTILHLPHPPPHLNAGAPNIHQGRERESRPRSAPGGSRGRPPLQLPLTSRPSSTRSVFSPLYFHPFFTFLPFVNPCCARTRVPRRTFLLLGRCCRGGASFLVLFYF